MKTLNDIRQQIAPALERVEVFRKEKLEAISSAKKWYIIPIITLGVALVAGFGGIFALTFVLGIIALIAAVLIAAFVVEPHRNNYAAHFKKEVFTNFVEKLYPDTYYAPANYLPSNLFKESRLFGSYDDYKGEDYFEGITDNGCSFKFSELHVTETHRDSDGDTRTSTVFDGLFFVLSVPNHVHGQIQVLPDSAESTLGFIGKYLQKSLGALFQGAKLVYLEEHPEFEKEFVVYSKDEDEARRILTPGLIEAIYDLRYKWDTRLRISFINQHIYVALSNSKNFFHPDIHRTVLDDFLLKELYDELALCFSVIEDLSIEQKKGYSPKKNWNTSSNEKPPLYTNKKSNNNPFLL